MSYEKKDAIAEALDYFRSTTYSLVQAGVNIKDIKRMESPDVYTQTLCEMNISELYADQLIHLADQYTILLKAGKNQGEALSELLSVGVQLSLARLT